MAHALSLLRWQLYACKTQHAFVLSQGHTANSVTSIFGSLQIEFWQHGLHFNISTRKICSRTLNHFWQLIRMLLVLYQVNKLYSFPPLVWTPLAVAREQTGSLGCSDTNTSLVPFSAVVPQWMQYTWIHYEYINCFWSHPKGLWQVKWPTCSCTVLCALAMVVSLEIKALNKATRKQGLCSSKRVLYQCRLARSVEVLSWHHHKNQLSNTLDPPPASGTCTHLPNPCDMITWVMYSSHIKNCFFSTTTCRFCCYGDHAGTWENSRTLSRAESTVEIHQNRLQFSVHSFQFSQSILRCTCSIC